jgi:hypothetical protein
LKAEEVTSRIYKKISQVNTVTIGFVTLSEMESEPIDALAYSPSSGPVPPATNREADQTLLFNTEGHFNTFQADVKAINKQHRDA